MDELRKEEIKRTEENLAGYLKEKELQERKIAALNKQREAVMMNNRLIKPVYGYHEDPMYWEATNELFDIRTEEDLFNTNKVLTTVNETIPGIKKSLQRLKGEDNE